MRINLGEPSPAIPLLPTGSLIMTNNKFGHEMIAGPLVGDQQLVGHKEPGIGLHLEPIESAMQRYPFTAIQAPVSDYHGALSWVRMEQQVGEEWTPFDNCQHAAREAYYGVPNSPTVNGLAVGAGCLFLLWLASRN
jgi:hypothetical protein